MRKYFSIKNLVWWVVDWVSQMQKRQFRRHFWALSTNELVHMNDNLYFDKESKYQ